MTWRDRCRWVLEAWRAPTGQTTIVLCRPHTRALAGTIRSPLALEQLAEIDLTAHRCLVYDGSTGAVLAAPIFARRVLMELGEPPTRATRREHVEIVNMPRGSA